MKDLTWGIIGTGAIASAFAEGLRQSRTGRLVAVASRDGGKAAAFAEANGAERSHDSYESLLRDGSVEAVYISTPHPFHAQWGIRALEAGRHVLCEKPLALNQWQADAMFAAAEANHAFLAEAFMYRCHPQIRKLVELLQAGRIGEVRCIRASFGFGGGDSINPHSRLFDNRLAGGGILDVGCYAVSAARLVAGVATGQPFANPVRVVGTGHRGSTGVDEWAAAVLQFESGITAQVATSIRARLDNVLEIHGSAGRILLGNPWAADREKAVTAELLVEADGQIDTFEIAAPATTFTLEADMVADCVAEGRMEPRPPAVTWADTLGNLAALDAWRAAVGVVPEDEKPAARHHDIAGRPVRVRLSDTSHNMKYGLIEGLDKPVSRFILGALAAHGSFPKAQVLFDHWLHVGGNAFDTGHVYNGCDRILGLWLQSRRIRDDVVLVAKGAHTPFCNPVDLVRELDESLADLQTDYADIYIMHRDNPDVPVGEFMDVLNQLVEAGRIRVFGGSNWSPERFSEANAYAREKGLREMSILNNNLSLARMVDPVWSGCIHMSERESRAWLARNHLTHFAWSSQARGFFTERTDRELESPGFDPELRRCWISPGNLERRRRALEMAGEKGVRPINIAAAYVLNQAFASYALIGPESVRELESSLPALDLRLTPGEIEYLWGE
jgi:predicted dehydrogenase/aryl-alcohol dehydrogenase-like predicted oxidoreductase